MNQHYAHKTLRCERCEDYQMRLQTSAPDLLEVRCEHCDAVVVVVSEDSVLGEVDAQRGLDG